MADKPEWFEELEHTADCAIRVYARDLEELFERSALAMFWLIADLSKINSKEELFLKSEGVDYEDLLIAWLNDLNSLHQLKGIVFNDFNVISLSPEKITAKGKGMYVYEHGIIRREIKAATFHGLSLNKAHAFIFADIIFDV